MNRLTERNKHGEAYYPQCIEICAGWGCTENCDDCNVNYAICEKLAAYEDTGLTPEQIREMDKLYLEKCRSRTKESESMTNNEKKIADILGFESRLNKLQEEMSELSQVICKRRGFREGEPLAEDITEGWLNEHLLDEIADVQAVLEQIIYLANAGEKVERIRRQKAERTLERIGGVAGGR